MNKPVLLVGAGPMAADYAAVLKAQNIPFVVVSRGTAKAEAFETKTGIRPVTGGLAPFLESAKPGAYTHAIVATGVEALADNGRLLLDYGLKHILLEKPGGRNKAEIEALASQAAEKNAEVLLAYNRRFYASVQKVRELAAADGGVESFHFEFTEWGHRIAPLQKAEGVKASWFLANSTHVADMAFYLGGAPEAMQSFTAGGCDWHPAATVFAGAGRTVRNALFSYQAHWEAPGRWSVEVITKKRRYYLKPLEEIQVQENGSVQVVAMPCADELDKQFKPGLYRQVAAWLTDDHSQFCSIQEQAELMKWYNQMSNYGN